MMSNQKNASDNPKDQEHHPSKSKPLQKQEYYYSGMLPLSNEFEAYERAVPGTGDRIVSMAENREDHRQNLQSKEQIFHYIGRYLSKGIVFAVAMFALWIGKILIESDQSAWGIGIILGELVLFAGIVIWGRYKGDQQ